MRAAVQQLLSSLPLPPSAAPLQPIRDAVVAEQIERLQGERAAIATRYRLDRNGGRAAFSAMAERLLADHRRMVQERLRAEGGPTRLLALLDAQLLRMPLSPPPPLPRGAVRLERLSGALSRIFALLEPALADLFELRVLDLLPGQGDLAAGLAQWAQAQGKRLSLSLVQSPDAPASDAIARLQALGLTPAVLSLNLLDLNLKRGAFDLVFGWGLVDHLGVGGAAVAHWEASRASRLVMLVERWRTPERALLAGALAGRPAAMRGIRGGMTPQEMRLLTATTLGYAAIHPLPPGVIVSLWDKRTPAPSRDTDH